MDNIRLKLKIGPHEIDAEGTPESVQAQLEAFTALVKLVGGAQAPLPTTVSLPAIPSGAQVFPPSVSQAAQSQVEAIENTDLKLGKIMRHDDRVVSLTVRARSVDDAVLLILYGQKFFRANDSVTGNEVMQGLAVTGQRVARVDRVLDKAARDGDAIVIGEHRARRYRLTNTGLTKARELANDLIATVA